MKPYCKMLPKTYYFRLGKSKTAADMETWDAIGSVVENIPGFANRKSIMLALEYETNVKSVKWSSTFMLGV